MIFVLQGDDHGANALLGQTIRATQINAGKGALLVLHDQDGSPIHLLEKIIVGDKLVPGTPASEVNWKPDSAIVLEQDRVAILNQFEELAPGFNDMFGPVIESRTQPARPPRWWESMLGIN